MNHGRERIGAVMRRRLVCLFLVAFGGVLAVPGLAQLRELRVGERVLGTIKSGGGSDRYSLVITSTTAVTIRMEKVLDSSIDSKITVLDASGSEIGSDDDSGEGLNSLLFLTLSPGRYTLVAQAVGSTSGDYVLRIEEQQRVSLSLGTAVLGELKDNVPELRYTVTVPRSTTLRIRMNKVLNSSVDPKVRLLDSQGNEIASDDDGGEGLNALLRQAVSAGEYTVVAQKAGDESGKFFLSIYDQNAPLTGTELRVGGSATGTVNDAMLPVRTKLVITDQTADVRITASKQSGSSLDANLVVLNSDGEVIASDDDSGEGTDAMVTLSLERSEYELFVGAYGTTTGSFRLAVDAIQLQSISVGATQTGFLGSGSVELYRFAAPRSMDLVITADKTGESDLDPKVTLKNSSGTEIGSDDDSGEGNNARLTTRVDAGTYQIVVSGYGTTSGSYALSVREAVSRSYGTVHVGDNRTGTLSGGEQHTYTLEVPSSMSVTIDLEKTGDSSLDPQLALRRTSGEEIATDDDGGESLNSRITRRVQAGNYQIVAKAYGSTSGAYRLRISSETAASVEVGMRRLGTITRSGQEDRYQYAVDSRQSIIIRVDKVLDSQLDPKVVVYDSQGNEVGSDDDGGEGLNARLQQTFDAGAYDIAVTGVGSSTGDYVLSVERVVNLSQQSLPDLRLGSQQIGSIRTARQSDTYRLALSGPTDVIIRLDKLGSSALDPKLSLESDTGEEIASDDDGGGGNNSLLRRTLPAGTYAVIARGYGETTGDYVLAVERDQLSQQNLGAISGSRAVDGSISSHGERDVYTFSVGSRTRVSIGMDRVGSEGVDPYLELYDANGGEIATNDDGGSGVNALIEQELNSGSYRLVARSYGSSTGPYRLSFYTGERTVNDRRMGDVQLGETRDGAISGGAEQVRDIYRLQVSGPTQVEIRMDKRGSSAIDPHLALLDSKGDQIDMNDDGGEGLNALIRRELAPGEYSIVASAYARTSGDYTLRVEGIRGGGQILSFDNTDHGFGLQSDSQMERALAIGKYSFRSFRGDNQVWALPLGRMSDGSFRVSMLKMEGPDRKGYGLCLRVHGRGDAPNMYLFEINTAGQYRFRKRDNARWSDIIPWTESSAIAKGNYAQNTLRVQADGPNFILYINETEVNRATDSTFADGYVGLSVSEGLHVLFDNLEVPAGAGSPSPGGGK